MRHALVLLIGCAVLSLIAAHVVAETTGDTATSQPATDSAVVEQHGKDWLSIDELRTTFLVRPSVEELKGRYFVIARDTNLNSFSAVRTRQDLRYLKRMGVTDIVQLTLRSLYIYHPTEVPEAIVLGGRFPSLKTVTEEAKKEGIKIWVKFQIGQPMKGTGFKGNKRPVHEAMIARHRDGTPYEPEQADVLCPEYIAFLHKMIDDYRERYDNIEGIMIDFPWSMCRFNYFEDDLELFDKFCQERFGEALPEDIGEKVDKGRSWIDVEDKWWRRFVLFRRSVQQGCIRDLAEYAHSKGFKVHLNVAANWSPPEAAHYPYTLLDIVDTAWAYPETKRSPLHICDKVNPGTNYYSDWGLDFTHGLRGHENGGLYYFFGNFWQPMRYGLRDEAARLKQHITNCREWAGARSLTKVGILHNHNALCLLNKHIRDTDVAIGDTLSRHMDVSRLYVGWLERYPQYSVVIVPPLGAKCLSKEHMALLKKYIERGGTVINIGGTFSTANADLTNEEDVTEEMTGIPLSSLASSSATDDGPLIAHEKAMGKGKIITLKCPDTLMERLAAEDEKTAGRFAALVEELAQPEIWIRPSAQDSDVELVSTLKKNNWVAAALYPNAKAAHVKVFFDMERLGVKSPYYRVLLLGQQAELHPAFTDNRKALFWKEEQLRDGIDIAILPDNDRDLKLPELKIGDKSDPHHVLNNWVVKVTTELFEKSRVHRSYEHEIVVVTPYDELTIDGEKAD